MFKRVKFACVFAAREGSRRLRNKNTRMCAGKSLWGWTKQAVEDAGIFDSRIITTDIDSLYRPFRASGWLWATRPEELAGDDVHISDVMQWIAQRDYVDHEYLCLVSPTNPLRTGAHICAAAELMLKEKADAVVAVAPCHPKTQNLQFPPNSPLITDCSDFVELPTQHARKTYRLTGSIVIAKTELWARKASMYNDPDIRTVGCVMPKYDIDIDDKEDLLMAEAMICHLRKKRTSLKSSLMSAIQARRNKKSQE